jgi:hypothetical protein
VSRRKSLAVIVAGLLAVTSLLEGCSQANLTDPREILSKVDDSITNLQSVHFHLEAGGQFAVGVEASAADTPVPSDTPSTEPSASTEASASASTAAAASGSAGASLSPSPSPSPTPEPTASPSPSEVASPTATPTPIYTAVPVSLAGTVADGDIDFGKGTAHVIGGMPGLPGVSGEMLVVEPYAYVRGYGETRFHEQGSSELAVDPALASQSLYIVQQVVAAASDKSLSPVLVGTEQEPGGSCYHIRVAVTQAALGAQLANLGAVQNEGTGQLDLWITQNDFQLERLEFSTADPAAGTAIIRLVLSNWNRVGIISGPAPNQIVTPAPVASNY